MNNSTHSTNGRHVNRVDLVFPAGPDGEKPAGPAPVGCPMDTPAGVEGEVEGHRPQPAEDGHQSGDPSAPKGPVPGAAAARGDAQDGGDENPPAPAALKPAPGPDSPLAASAVPPSSGEEGMAEVLPPEFRSYPLSLSPDDTYRVLRRELPEPQMDRQFILAVSVTGGNDGGRRVAEHHAALFLSVHGLKVRALEDQEQARTRRVAARQREAADLTFKLKNTDRYHDSHAPKENVPWNLHDVLEVAALAGCSLLCLGIGVANITNLLQSSGEPAFRDLWRALPFGLGVVIGAISLKAFARLFPDGPLRRTYGFTLFGVGLVSFLLWLGGFSALFSGALTPVGDLLANLGHLSGAPDPAAGTGIHASVWMMFAGCLSDAALSAGAWIVAQMVCNSHHRPRRSESQAWSRVRTDLNRVLRHLHDEEALLGLVRGALQSERAQQAVFMNKAVALHDAATASQRQTREALQLQ